jgi:hypothetical protein
MLASMTRAPDSTNAAARSAHCWFSTDHVSRDSACTDWKRRARLRQATWRSARGFPVGSQPYGGGDKSTPVGSRLELAFAKTSGANFLSPAALRAVRARLANPERHQMLNEERLWADLLSSMPLCFNLFGEFAEEAERAARALTAWWPDAPPGPVTLRFEHSPGRSDPLYLGNKSAFDVAFDLGGEVGPRAIVGVETKYHEHAKAEPVPPPRALARYTEVTERSGVFADDWRSRLLGTELQQIWLDHLLALSMLQHPNGRYAWARFVLVYPAENPSFARAAAVYREVLRDPRTFEARTIEELLGAPGVLEESTCAAFRARYL